MPSLLRIGKYQLDSRLGPDGVIETYRAHGIDRVAAEGKGAETFVVKLLRTDCFKDQAYAHLESRFLAAGRRLLVVQPSQVGRVAEVGEEAAGAFVVRRFVAGVDLVGLLAAAEQQAAPGRAGLDPAVVSVVGGQIARVLADAHAAIPPLCHLALSPGNVVVTPTGDIAVLDFGLFASVRGLVDHPIEKWLFVAPELLGVATDAQMLTGGQAADVYSLGALLHFLLMGANSHIVPQSMVELADRAGAPLPDIPGVPAPLAAAIRAMTAPDPKHRPESANLLCEWLAGHGPPHATKPTSEEGRQEKVDGDTTLPALRERHRAVLASAGVAAKSAAVTVGHDRDRRPVWLLVLVAAIGMALVVVFGALAFRVSRSLAAKRTAQGVAIAHRRSGETPAGQPPPKVATRRLPPESYLPAIPTPLPPPARAVRVPDAAPPPRNPESDSIPVFPAGRFVVEDSDRPPPKRVPNHLFVDSQPHGAAVWVEGEWKGQTPIDIATGPGAKHLVVVAAGYHMFRETFDAAEGVIFRPALVPVLDPVRGDAFVNVVCRTVGRYPVFIDEVETGMLCPVSRLPVAAGVHRVGVFVPRERKLVAEEITAPAGPKPVEVKLAR